MAPKQKTINIKKYMLQRFSKKATSKAIYQKISSMKELEGLSVWPEEPIWLDKICDYLEQCESNYWSDRKFRIFYGQSVTKLISIYDYLEACILDDPKQLFFCIKNIYDRFAQSSVTLLSIRDVLEDYEKALAQENLERFTEKGLLETNFPHPSKDDVARHASKPPTMIYKGVLPNSLDSKDFYSLFERMIDIKTVAKRLIDEGVTISPTHIVISGFHQCLSNKNLMIITGTNTFKDRINLFTDTPIVARNREYYYYGDPTIKPSTESIPHWLIQSRLLEEKNPGYKYIIHIHNEQMTTISETSDIRTTSVFIPTIPHYAYGTEEIGSKIFDALKKFKTFGVSVRAHGQWFIGENIDDLLTQIIDISNQLRKPYEGTFLQTLKIKGKSRKLSAFISHSGKTKVLGELTTFVENLGIEPILAIQQPNKDRNIDKKVMDCLNKADLAIFLATSNAKDKKGHPIPGGNVIHEIGLAQAKRKFTGKIIYLLEKGTEFPSNIKSKVYIGFKHNRINEIFGNIVTEIEKMDF